MKLKYRPMAIMGFSSLFVLFVCTYFDDRFSFAAIGAGVLLLVLCIFLEKLRSRVTPFFLAAALIFSGISFEALTDYKISTANELVGKSAVVTATVLDEPEFKHSKYYYILETDEINSQKFKTKLRLSAANYIDAEPYDTIKLNAKLYDIGASSRDTKLYFQSKGIFLGGYISNYDDYPIEITKHADKPVGYYLYRFRRCVENRILDKLPNDYGGVTIGMLIGNKDYISDEVSGYIKSAGVAPVFAVSGMHLSVWVMGLYALLEIFNVRKRLNSAISITFVVLFMAATGFTASVCRSGIMLIFVLVGNLFYRKADSVNSLGLAALILSAINPMITADIGFILSFSSTLGIVLLNPYFNKYVVSKIPNRTLSFIPRAVLEAIFVSLSATLGSLGFVIVFIGYISTYSVLSNMLISYAASLCMLMGGMTVLFSPLGFVGDIFAVITGCIAKYIIAVIKLISSFPSAVIPTDNIAWTYAVIVSFTVIISCFTIFKRRTAAKISFVGVALTVAVCVIFTNIATDGYDFAEILNVDNDIAVVLENGNKRAVIMSDGKYAYTVDSVSSAMGLNTENEAVIADSGKSNLSNVLSLLKKEEFDKVIVPRKTYTLSTVCGNDRIFETGNADIHLWETASIRFISNDDYAFAQCDIQGITVMFVLRGEDDIPDEFMSGDVLVCGSTPESCDFSRIIISGESDSDSHVSTQDCGNIMIKIKNGQYKIMIEEDG